MSNNQQQPPTKWHFWVDRGGTFTDVVAMDPQGGLVTRKLLSENPKQYQDAALQGIREILDIKPESPIPEEMVGSVKMGTTVATNALLERKGTPTLLAITQGFKDALQIGYQNRPALFELRIQKPELLYQQVVEIDERIDAQGAIIKPLDLGQAGAAFTHAYRSGLRSIAIVLMHGYRHTDHEEQLVSLAQQIGFTQISASHQASPLMKLVSRGDTTVVDAYLSPILRHYINRVAAQLGAARLMFMQSNGSLTNADRFQGKDSILSGPAGGIVGAAKSCLQAGHRRIIAFDMGGTSTDVSHFDGEYERTFDSLVAGVRMRAPMMQIHTVAAGGGSIVRFDGARLRVGPESAGANPGPACYRQGGPLTVTDCNLMLGKINPDLFPRVFGESNDQPLDLASVRHAFAELADDIQQQTGQRLSPMQIADGFLKIAVDNMANAIKQISTQRGYDVTTYTLCSFGGAGGQHACRVADALGIKKIILHPLAGVLSAYGMGLADLGCIHQQTVEQLFDPSLAKQITAVFNQLEQKGRDEMSQQVDKPGKLSHRRTAYLKYQGTDSSLPIQFADYEFTQAAFATAHYQHYGFTVPDKPLILESISVETICEGQEISAAIRLPKERNSTLKAEQYKPFYSNNQMHTASVYCRAKMVPGDQVDGPAIITESTGTTIIEPGWRATLSELSNLELERVIALPSRIALGTQVDPVMLEVFNNLFMSIAEQMGTTLANTSYSVNVKERLDFSCAIFSGDGDLVANAPHMPVHLGSMGESVKSVISRFKDEIMPGDAYVTNAPYNGGTHLPDITVITPVFDKSESEILFYVASRGHHADIGGISPGSMPPDSVTVEQEGVLFDNVRLLRQGEFREVEIREPLCAGPWPARNPDQNIADLKAQIAANNKGVSEMWRMIEHFGTDTVLAYMQHVQDNAEAAVRKVIGQLKDCQFTYPIDDLATIQVRISLNKERTGATVDFTGTSEQLPNNFNAPSAICKAAVLYVFRTLVQDDIPMNQGCLKPIQIIIPEGSMLNPEYPAAVVAGNVETSQWIVNVLYGALGVCAAAQGTMNNFTFGDDSYQYYETIAGGMGAGPDFEGADAVQTHMTNSRLTDPEVLEWRYPVLVEDFSIRQNSGGKGMQRGGNGVIRKIRFLQPMTAAILSSHRITRPFGLCGGESGKAGVSYVETAEGNIVRLKATDSIKLNNGDTFVIETPGGGGYGLPSND